MNKPTAPPLPTWVPIVLLAALPLWAAALYGVLQIHRVPEIGSWLGHGVCGPWGCAARPEALLGYHAFWLTLLGPIGFVLGLRINPSLGRVVWSALATLGVLLTVAIVGWAILHCLMLGPENLRQYWLQIAGFRLATNTDLPSLPILLAGLTCRLGLAIQKKWLPRNLVTDSDTHLDPTEQSPAVAAGSLGTL